MPPLPTSICGLNGGIDRTIRPAIYGVTTKNRSDPVFRFIGFDLDFQEIRLDQSLNSNGPE